MPSKQETFDLIAAHLIKQNAKSLAVDPESPWKRLACAYRGQGGMKCAAGAVLPDDRYEPSMEGGTVVPNFRASGARPRSARVSSALEEVGHDLTLVHDLQQVHDYYETPEWPDALIRVATRFELDTGIVQRTLAERS